ncbi:YycH family regulatory protein [Bhargavaea cecembensis]|uniref:YycH family regulatory protein n=1 Tax=Bhargavaea cecembensis TaxID=394098 RepID=UPI00058DB37D|nr:two-component system activity regulator YycH [Bhargavaea cecembensis]
MGLKYVEQVKSAVLILLIVLSVTLTFSIWTYKPNYEPIEKAPTADVSIADKRKIEDIIKPYKLLANSEEGLKGTTDQKVLGEFVDNVKTWTFQDLTLSDPEVTAADLNEIVGKPGRLVLFFPAPIPFGVIDNLFKFTDSVSNESSFERIIIEKPDASGRIAVHFAGGEGGRMFTAMARGVEQAKLNEFLTRAETFPSYAVVKRQGARSLYLPDEPASVDELNYLMEEVSPSQFRRALFGDKNTVKREQGGSCREEYSDNAAIMSVDTCMKTLSYVYPHTNAENKEVSIPSELLLGSLDFINQHGGWTNDFVFAAMDPIKRQVEFRLQLRGYPVFSNTTWTHITQVWGDGRIFRYMRPYYSLDGPFPGKGQSILEAGTDAAEWLRAKKGDDFSEIGEIMQGYTMRQGEQANLYLLEPAWYYKENGTWKQVKPEEGGAANGLE